MAKEYLVGIDFGHGETTASYIEIPSLVSSDNDGKKEPEEVKVQRLKIQDNDDYKIRSAVYRKPKGHNSYDYDLGAGDNNDIYFSFKRKVKKLNIYREDREAFENFIRMVYALILRNNKFLSENGNRFLLYIAAPTKWSDADKADYKRFVENAIGRDVEWVINESDAGYYQKKASNSLVLVVDYGSSTIDFTLINNGKKVDGFDELSADDLGAQGVELSLFEAYRTQEDAAEYKRVKEICEGKKRENSMDFINVDSAILFSLRECKEVMYANHNKSKSVAKNLPHILWDFHFINTYLGHLEKRDEFFYTSFMSPEREKDLNKENDKGGVLRLYIDEVHAHFIKVKEAIVERGFNLNDLQIILSGGASRMPWVRTCLSEVFGIPLETIEKYQDDRPEYIVSDGIVKYAYELYKVRDKIAPIISEIDDYIFDLACDMEYIVEDVCEKVCLDVVQQDKNIQAYRSVDFQDGIVDDDNPENSVYKNYYKSSILGLRDIIIEVNKSIYRDRSKINKEIIKQIKESIHKEVNTKLQNVIMELFGKNSSFELKGQPILPDISDDFTIGMDELNNITSYCRSSFEGTGPVLLLNTKYGDGGMLKGSYRKERKNQFDRVKITEAYFQYIRDNKNKFKPYSEDELADIHWNIKDYVISNIVSFVEEYLTFNPCGYDLRKEILAKLNSEKPTDDCE